MIRGEVMENPMARYSLITLMLVTFAPFTLQAQTPTEQTRQVSIVQDMAPVSLSYGQTLRITVINPLPPPGADGRKFKMLVAATILDCAGRVLASRDEITLNPGEFHSFDFNRADLPSPGRTDTGLLQLRGEIRRRFYGGVGSIAVAGGDVNDGLITFRDLNGVIELIDNLTGQTQAAAALLNDVALTDSSGQFQTQSSLLGLTYGQSLRVSVAHPNRDGQRQTLRARIVLSDPSGTVLAQSDELSVPPGAFRSYEFPRTALPVTGENPTGRVQMAANVFLKFDSVTRGEVAVILELVDNSTGRTIGLLLPAIQVVRCASRSC
jgi:hypothetical protein